MIRNIILIVAVTVLLMGCQTLSERKQSDALQRILRSYEAMIRWGSVEQAKGFLRPGQAGEVEAATPKNVRVTHYEVVQGPATLDSNRAMQTALIQYVFEESQIVKEMMNQQTWEYDQESERWFLVTPLPAFK